MKHKKYLISLLVIINFTIVGWVSFVHPHWLLNYGIFTCLAGYLLILICVTEAGSIKLGTKENTPSFGRWLGQVILAQLLMLFLTFSVTNALLGAGPHTLEGQLSVLSMGKIIKDYSLWQWGLFPWGIFGLWGLVLCYGVYVKQGQPFLYQIGKKILPRRIEPMFKAYIEGTSIGATIIAFSLVVASIILLFSYAIEPLFKVDHLQVPLFTFFLLSFFIPLLSFKWGRKIISKLMRRGGTLNRLFNIIIVVLIPILLGCAFADAWLFNKYQEIAKLQCRDCQKYFIDVTPEVRFAALYWGWWLIWTPLAGSYLAKISQGRSIREYVLGINLLPICLVLFLFNGGAAALVNLTVMMTRSIPSLYIQSLLIFAVAILTWVLFAKMIKGCKTTTLFSSGFMPVNESSTKNRLWLNDAVKVLAIKKEAQKITLCVIGVIFLHTVMGWYGIQIQVAAMGLLMINAVYLGLDLMVIAFFKDKAWLGNKNIPKY